MTNAITVPQSFNGQVAAVFQGQQAADDLSAGITGGYGLIKYRGKVWSIQHNGQSLNLMRPDGDGPRGSIDVVILKANANLSKTFYINGFDENSNNPPDCASANGIVPDQGVPHKQSNVCATCPKNAWGSAPNGGKGKACGDHRRLAVTPLDDLKNELYGGAMLLRCPAASLQDLAAFSSKMQALGYPYFTIGIKIGFDANESYPKFTFQPIRPLTDVEGRLVLEMRDSPEVARVISEGTAPPPAQVTQPAQGVFLEQLPPGTPTAAGVTAQPQQVQVQPAPQPAVAQPAPVAAQPQPQPVAAQPVGVPPASGGGFGPVSTQPAAGPAPAAVQPAPQPAQVAQPAPQQRAQQAGVAMTGFGPVTPEVTQTAAPAVAQPVAQPAPEPTPAPAVAQPAPVTPGVVSAFEGSIDERLDALLK